MCGYGYAVRPLSIWTVRRFFCFVFVLFFYFCKSHRVLKSIKILLNCRPSGLIQRIYQKECIVVVVVVVVLVVMISVYL